MTSHANCTHPATKAARTACRKLTTPAPAPAPISSCVEVDCTGPVTSLDRCARHAFAARGAKATRIDSGPIKASTLAKAPSALALAQYATHQARSVSCRCASCTVTAAQLAHQA